MLESREFRHCTFCHKSFGFRSDSGFCGIGCQVGAAASLDPVAGDRVEKVVVKKPRPNIFSSENVLRVKKEREVVEEPKFLDEPILTKDFAVKWERYQKLKRMKD